MKKIIVILALVFTQVILGQFSPAVGVVAAHLGGGTAAPAEPYYGLAGASYDNISKDVNTELAGATMFKLSVSPDYLMATGSGELWRFTMDDSDISQISYTSNYTSSLPGTMQSHQWADSGNKIMAMSGSEFSFSYSLSTAYDLTTITTGNSGGPYTDNGTNIRATIWNPEGTIAYNLDASADVINQYDITPAYGISYTDALKSLDISTAPGIVDPRDICFSPDGKTLLIVDYTSRYVYEFTLGTAWDISTGYYANRLDISGQLTNGYSVTYNNDGSKILVGALTRVIYQYDVASLGDELVVNGDMASSTGWTVANNTTITGGVAVLNTAEAYVYPLRQTFGAIPDGQDYRVAFDIVNYTSGSVRVAWQTTAGPANSISEMVSAAGHYEFVINLPVGTTPRLIFANGSSGSVLDIDNVTVKQVN